MIVFTIPRMRLVNISNVREHWSKRAERTAAHRTIGRAYMRAALGRVRCEPPYDVTIVRIGPGKMDRSNLFVASKALEDGLCDALGVNDGDEGAWLLNCRQERPPKGAQGDDRYAVRFENRAREAYREDEE